MRGGFLVIQCGIGQTKVMHIIATFHSGTRSRSFCHFLGRERWLEINLADDGEEIEHPLLHPKGNPHRHQEDMQTFHLALESNSIALGCGATVPTSEPLWCVGVKWATLSWINKFPLTAAHICSITNLDKITVSPRRALLCLHRCWTETRVGEFLPVSAGWST